MESIIPKTKVNDQTMDRRQKRKREGKKIKNGDANKASPNGKKIFWTENLDSSELNCIRIKNNIYTRDLRSNKWNE